MRILFLTNILPYPLHGGVQLRVFNLASRIARVHDVTVGGHIWNETDRDHGAYLSKTHFRTVCGPVYAFHRGHLIPAVKAALRGTPPETVQYHSPILRNLAAEGKFDLVQVEETLLAPYIDSLPPGTPAKTVLTFHNIHFEQARRIAALEVTPFRRLYRRGTAAWMRAYEPRIARRFHRVITVTADDRRLLSEAAPGLAIDVLPNGVDTAGLQPLPPPAADLPPAVVFVGSMNYLPCIDAATWLVREILPLLRAALPNLEVWIVGRGVPPSVAALAGPGVHITGAVEDTRPYYARSAVAVVPLRAGGGSRLKILEAMALGRPVVSTTIGAEGIDARDNRDIVLADNPESFAAAVEGMFTRPALAASIAANARRHVEANHDWDGLAARQMEIYDALIPHV